MSRGPEPPLLSGRRPALLARLVLNGFCQAAAAVALALLVERAFDGLIVGEERATGNALPLAGALLAAVAVSAWLRAAERATAERLGQEYVYELRAQLYERLLSIAPRQLERRSTGAMSLRFVGDVSAIRQWFSLGLASLIVGGCFVGGALVAMAFVNLRIALALAGVLAAGTLAAFGLGGAQRRAAREARRHAAASRAWSPSASAPRPSCTPSGRTSGSGAGCGGDRGGCAWR